MKRTIIHCVIPLILCVGWFITSLMGIGLHAEDLISSLAGVAPKLGSHATPDNPPFTSPFEGLWPLYLVGAFVSGVWITNYLDRLIRAVEVERYVRRRKVTKEFIDKVYDAGLTLKTPIADLQLFFAYELGCLLTEDELGRALQAKNNPIGYIRRIDEAGDLVTWTPGSAYVDYQPAHPRTFRLYLAGRWIMRFLMPRYEAAARLVKREVEAW